MSAPSSQSGRAAEIVRDAEAALQRRDPATALARLAEAEALDPGRGDVAMNRALAFRLKGDLPAALAALDAALAVDPYNFMALLSKGVLLDKMGRTRAAALVCRDAIRIAPPPERLPRAAAAALEQARALVRRNGDELAEYMRRRVGALDGALDPAVRRRFEEGLEVLAGRAKPAVQEPILFHYPRLPAIPFYDRSLFPWLERLEAATETIQAELEALNRDAYDAFAPYIAYPPGAPVNQWRELNHSPRWNAYHLWKDGVRQAAACERCPRTAELLESLPMQQQPGFAPTAVFSVLAPRTHIPPHTGSANTRLLVHLPLVLPGPARFRVGNETRQWRMGEAWVFDDTIEHEAWNDADQHRTILIFDVWNPYLDEAERALISAMMTAKNDFQAGRPL